MVNFQNKENVLRRLYSEEALIQNLIYLDVNKLYSMSSQIFEGVTEYIINKKHHGVEESETQKGPVTSGKVLGDIIRNNETVSEGRVLNDYSFSLFQKKLLDQGKVKILNQSDVNINLHDLKLNSFVAITSTVTFNDMRSIKNTIGNFNRIGRALAYVTTRDELTQLVNALGELGKGADDIAAKKIIDARIKILSNPDALQKDSGLYQDPTFVSELGAILDYGFQEQLEVQLDCDGKIFSANLKREYLRENEELIIRKYARKTEVEFVLFGVVTQLNSVVRDAKPIPDDPKIKEALMGMIDLMAGLESTFTGRLANEVIIDPIALYTELK